MKLDDVKKGLKVKTIFNLKSTRGFFVSPQYVAARKPDAEGTVLGHVSGHGGDVWWVKHKDSSIGAYSFTEFNPK